MPRAPAWIRWGHPYTKDLRVCWLATQPWHELVRRVTATVVDVTRNGTEPRVSGGASVSARATTSKISFPDHDSYDVTGDITIMMGNHPAFPTGFTDDPIIVAKCDSKVTANYPYMFGISTAVGVDLVNIKPYFGRGSSGGARVWRGSTVIAINQRVLAVTQPGGAINTAPVFYQQGADVSGTPTSLYSTVGTGAAVANSTALTILNQDGVSFPTGGKVGFVYIWARVLSAAEIFQLSRQPFQFMFKHSV